MEQPNLQPCDFFCKTGPNGEVPHPIFKGQELIDEARESGIPHASIDAELQRVNNIHCPGINNFCPRFSACVKAMIWLHAQRQNREEILKRRPE